MKIVCGIYFDFKNQWAVENIIWTSSGQDKVRDHQFFCITLYTCIDLKT